jgi:MATE family multidrug resistance protein
VSGRPGEVREHVALALPLAAQQIGLQLMGAVDTAMLGRWDPAALAGAGVANGLVFAISCIGMGVVLGLDTLIPQALGAGERGRARALLGDGLRVALLVALPATLLTLAAPLILPWFGIDEQVGYQATIFVWARAFGVAPFMLQVALRAYLAAHGRTRPLVIAVVAGNLINLVGDYILIYGDRGLVQLGLPAVGLPELGVIGAAAATSLVQIATLFYYALAVRALHRDDPVPAVTPAPPSAVRRIIVLGTPIGLQLLAEVGVFALSGILAARIGADAAAAHSVAIQLASFTFSIAVGIGTATAVRVGRAVGAGDTPGARRAGMIGLGLGGAVMTATALVFLVTPRPLAALFTDDATVIAAAIPLLQIAALFQLSDGAQAVLAGALRGAGDTRWPFYANMIGHYGLGLGVSIVLGFQLGLGTRGLWWGLSAGLILTSVILIARFRRVTSSAIARA